MNPIYPPVPGGVFESTWHAPRSGGRLHEGVDIFAKLGTPVYAIADGMAYATEGENQGTGISLIEADGTRYTYAHLSEREGSFPRKVTAGDLIGYVGDTGNAKGLPPHLHFEARPEGGEKVDPFEFLQFLKLSLDGEEAPGQVGPVPRGERGGGFVWFALGGAGLLWLVLRR